MLAVNVAGAALYLGVASLSWGEIGPLSHENALTGSAVGWGISALPLLVSFAVINGYAGVFSLIYRVRVGVWPLSILLWLVVPIWGCAVAFDFAGHIS